MSNLTLLNLTNSVAQYVVMKGEQVIARIPGIEPNARLTIPTDETYQVIATALIDGNTYASSPKTVKQSMGFLARVLQKAAQGTYEFDVQEVGNNLPSTLAFQKTCLGPVTFTITKNGVALQNVVVPDSFQVKTLDISDTFHVYAVVNGVTTETIDFTDPGATITAITDTSILESGYATLVVN